MFSAMATLIKEAYVVVIAVLSIAVLLALQYLTRGVDYFLDKGRVRWNYLAFIAILQFCISCLITWSVITAFTSEYLGEYDSLKMTAVIILGACPFNITILVWVALKLEIFKIMRNRYGEEFDEDELFKKAEGLHGKRELVKIKPRCAILE